MSTCKVSVCKSIHIFLNSSSDLILLMHILVNFIYIYIYIKKNSLSLSPWICVFLVLFLLKVGLPLMLFQQRLKMRQHFMYPCRLFIWSHVHSAYLLSTKAAGTQEHGRGIKSPASCCWVASLYVGWAEVGWGEVHTHSTSTRAHTGEHTPRQLHNSTFYHYRFWAVINNWNHLFIFK